MRVFDQIKGDNGLRLKERCRPEETESVYVQENVRVEYVG